MPIASHCCLLPTAFSLGEEDNLLLALFPFFGHVNCWLPSGKHTKNYGKSQFLMGKSTINGYFQ